jgi:hypothetical protein
MEGKEFEKTPTRNWAFLPYTAGDVLAKMDGTPSPKE